MIRMKSFIAEPASLVAIHTYLPSSTTFTLPKSSDPNGVIDMSGSLVGSNMTSSFFQVTSGSGSPWESQFRKAGSPVTTTVSVSPSELMVGGTVQNQDLQSIQCEYSLERKIPPVLVQLLLFKDIKVKLKCSLKI